MESTQSSVFPRTLSTSGQLVSTCDSHTTITSQECNSLTEDISRINISTAIPFAHLSTCTALPSSDPCTPSKPLLPSSLPSSISASISPHPLTCSHPSPTIGYKHRDLFYNGYRPGVIEAARISTSSSSSNGGGSSRTSISEPYHFSSNGGGSSRTSISEQYHFSPNGGAGSRANTSEQCNFSSNGGGGSGTNTSEQYDFSSESFWKNSYSSSWAKSPSYSCTNNCADALYDAICYGAASTD